MSVRIHPSWQKILKQEFQKPYFKKLKEFVRREYQQKTIYPPAKHIFRAFDKCPYDQVKVVILGQDPYHGPGQANGLCFSVYQDIPFPPSLLNIYKEIHSDLGKPIPSSGDLDHWAEQGVLLLNATLTVRAGQAGSHQSQGWEEFTDAVVDILNQDRENLVFLLWGAYAQKKGSFINQDKHLVLESPHPSPLSAHRGFFGNRHFSQTNVYLSLNGFKPIDW